MSVDTTELVNPFADGGVSVARCRAMAVKARRTGGEATYRCPLCHDLAWVFEQDTTIGGHKAEVAKRCAGPTASGCPQVRHDQDMRAKRQQTTATRGRMD